MNVYSNDFANFYDRFVGHDKKIIATTKHLILSSIDQKKSAKLLELACGTGTILLEMPTNFRLFGLDISPGMLKVAKEKVPNATFILGDMSKFTLRQKFNIIVCIFDSVNHLTTWEKWQGFFQHTAKHLDKNGVFIFDMNTMRRMALLATFKPYVKKVGKSVLTFVKVNQHADNIYRGQFIIVKKITTHSPIAIEEFIDEAVFPLKKVIHELKKHFTIEKMIDPYREAVTSETGRIFFVCRKKEQ